MKLQSLNYVLLALVLVVSFFSVLPYTIGYSDRGAQGGPLNLLYPGLAYSIFLTWVMWSKEENYPIIRLILFIPVMMVLYVVALFFGLQSWGVGVPFIGAIGAVLIRKLFYWNNKVSEKNFRALLIVGFVSGLVGVVLFYVATNLGNDGVGFGCILVTWQAAFGVKWILYNEPVEF